MRCAALLLTLSLLTAVPSHGAPMSPESFVLLDKEALLVTPPRLVAAGMVKQAEWSPDGKYALALAGEFPYHVQLDLTRPPAIKSRLVLWNAATGEAKELWTGEAPGETNGQFVWFSRGDAAVVLLDLDRPVPAAERAKVGAPTRRERWLYRLDARRGLMRPVTRVADHAQISSAPAAPGVIVWTWESPDRLLIRPEGPALPLRMPSGIMQGVEWLESGDRAMLGWALEGEGDKLRKRGAIIANVTTGVVSELELEKVRPWRKPEPAARVRLVRGDLVVREGDRVARLTPLWLESVIRADQPRVLLSAFAETAELSPRGESVLYTDDRGAWVVRPIIIAKEAFFQARQAAEQARVLSSGKQLGLALHMYASDHDERLPGADEPVNSLIGPYLGSDTHFAGFVYTFGGGPISSIAKPAELVMGHVLGPGGRALIYADGHVSWEPEVPRQ